MTAGVDPHIQALRDALVAEHEAHIAEIQRRCDDAAARGEEWYQRWYQRQVEDLKAMPYPWDGDEVA
jgi:hypothetical protein